MRNRAREINISGINQSGMAMPVALLVVMVVSIVGAIYARSTIQALNIAKSSESASDTFFGAEGAVQFLAAEMSIKSHLWRSKTSLADLPDGYTTYAPSNYAGTNGIPECAGAVSAACQRNMVPTGGGLLKNFGPIGGDGDNVNSSYSITEQLDITTPPTEDLILNNKPAWIQTERLDQSPPGTNTIGGELSNNPQSGNGASTIRFRITGLMTKEVKGRVGTSTVVSVVEMPVS